MAYFHNSGYYVTNYHEHEHEHEHEHHHHLPTTFSGNYEIAPSQALMSTVYSSYDLNDNYAFLQYDPIPYSGVYDPPISTSLPTYSLFTSKEHRYVEYDPISFNNTQNQNQVTFVYSIQEFNQPEFEEYDPTPYDGGFDLAATYGKPLPPSAEICYPLLLMEPVNSFDGFSYDSIESPYGKDQAEVNDSAGKVLDGTKLIPDKKPKKQSHDDDDCHHDQLGLHLPYSGYDKVVPEIVPPGYGLEAIDLCESLFGYWPCLSRYKRCQSHRESLDQEDCNWNQAADYLFGGVYDPYGGSWGVDMNPGYQRT